MSGIIVSTPPTVEVPPGNNASNPSSLPPVTYTYALTNIPQTWGAKQTFPAGNISLHAADIVDLSLTNISGNLPVTNLNSGTNASQASFWRGDGVWANSIFQSLFILPSGGLSTLRLGSIGQGTIPFLDFIDNGATANFGVRLLASGSGATDGSGTLNMAGSFSIRPIAGAMGLDLKTPGATPTVGAFGSVAGLSTVGQINDGSLASPHTANTPSVTVSRWEAQTSNALTGNAPALWVETVSHNVASAPSGNPNSNAVTGIATQYGAGDVVGLSGIATQSGGLLGSGQVASAFGGFFLANRTVLGQTYGINPVVENNSGVDSPYSGVNPGATVAGDFGIFIQPGGTNLCSAGVMVFGNSPQFDVGYSIWANSAKTAGFQDDSSSVTAFKAKGTHTNGVDLSGATITGSAFKSTGFNINGSGAITALGASLSTALGGTGNAGGAWTISSPTVTPQTGAFTTVSATAHYLIEGKKLHYGLLISITTAGTASGSMQVTLPATAGTLGGSFAASEAATSSLAQATVGSSTNTLNITKYDGTTLIANGRFIVVSGMIETA